MNNSRGMTLVEVVVSMALIGIIATVFFRTTSTGYVNTMGSNKFTKDSFLVQTDIENAIGQLKSTEVDLTQDNTEQKIIFNKKVKGHIVSRDIRSDSTSKHGEYTAFIPKIDITFDVPEIESVSLKVNGVPRDRVPILDKNKKINISLDFRGSKVDGSKKDFLMNVYTWYISPLVDEPIPSTDIEINEYINSNSDNFIILKQWNQSRKKQDYDFTDLSIVPNIEKDYDKFNFNEIKFVGPDSDKSVIDMFAGRFIVYGVTPYSTIGKMGEEVFSNPIYIENIK